MPVVRSPDDNYIHVLLVEDLSEIPRNQGRRLGGLGTHHLQGSLRLTIVYVAERHALDAFDLKHLAQIRSTLASAPDQTCPDSIICPGYLVL